MKKVGIICEYNPFHNGHIYHIEKIKEKFPDSIIILVLGSYFLERGEISLISKWNKTRIALEYGVNLVLELPTLYGTNSGDYFAYYAVKALNLAQVDCIVFGSESDNVELLKRIALTQEDKDFNQKIKSSLDNGINYPTSLSRALGVTLKSNDNLGVSYIKAINRINKNIEALTIKRTNDYNDIYKDDKIISASNIRNRLLEKKQISKYIPAYEPSFINNVDFEKLFELLKYRIMTEGHLENYLGVDEGLENKLKKEIMNSSSLEELLYRIKSKRYTITRLRRMLIHILLGIEKTDMSYPKEKFRILGFDSLGREHLKNIKSDYLVNLLDDKSSEVEKRAAFVYRLVTKDKSIDYEYLNKPIIK